MTCAIDASKRVLCFGINVRSARCGIDPIHRRRQSGHIPSRPTSRFGNRSKEADAGPTSSPPFHPTFSGRRWMRHRTTSAMTTTCNSSQMAVPWSHMQIRKTTTSRSRSSQMGSGLSRPRSPTRRPCSRHQWPSTTTTGSTSSQRIPPTTPPARTSCSRPRSRDDGSRLNSPVRKCQPRRHARTPDGLVATWSTGSKVTSMECTSSCHEAMESERSSSVPTPGSPTAETTYNEITDSVRSLHDLDHVGGRTEVPYDHGDRRPDGVGDLRLIHQHDGKRNLFGLGLRGNSLPRHEWKRQRPPYRRATPPPRLARPHHPGPAKTLACQGRTSTSASIATRTPHRRPTTPAP